MLIIKEKFPTYHEFAISSVNEIYSPELLSSADRYEVNELASGILFNNTDSTGNIEFVFKALPRIVQSSPVFGSTICDVNGDGNLDIYVVQNFSGPLSAETGYKCMVLVKDIRRMSWHILSIPLGMMAPVP